MIHRAVERWPLSTIYVALVVLYVIITLLTRGWS